MGQQRSNSPFWWERKAGVPKGTTAESFRREQEFVPKLQPPPCTLETAGKSLHSLQIPLPPCAFQPPHYRTFPKKKGLIRLQGHDPFFAAYEKCTQRNQKLQVKTIIKTRLRNSMSFFSCKRSCAVRDTNLVRISHLPPNADKD